MGMSSILEQNSKVLGNRVLWEMKGVQTSSVSTLNDTQFQCVQPACFVYYKWKH